MVPMVIPIPDVKPNVTDTGIYSIRRPKRARPKRIRNIPDMSVATSRPASPNCCDTGYRMTTKAAVGPDTLKRDPPVRAITIPATAEVYRPYCGATPLPIARAIASGMAMIPTVIPAIRSRVKREAVYFSFQQASMRARKGITCEENNLFTIMFHP